MGTKSSVQAGAGERPASLGRVLTAVGLLSGAVTSLLVLADADHVGPVLEVGDTVLVLFVGAGVTVGVGMLLTARALEGSGSADMVGRALGVTTMGVLAGFAFWQGGGYFEDTFYLSVLGILLALVAVALLFWFVHGVHRTLRPETRPLLLWAGAGSFVLALALASDTLTVVFGLTVPGVLLALALLRSPARA